MAGLHAGLFLSFLPAACLIGVEVAPKLKSGGLKLWREGEKVRMGEGEKGYGLVL